MPKWLHRSNEVLFPASPKETFFKEAVMAEKSDITFTGGPSREDLFDALRLRHEMRVVKFTINCTGERVGEKGTTEEFMVNSITTVGGDGNTWLLNLTLVRTRGTRDCYFDTNTRKGWVCEPCS